MAEQNITVHVCDAPKCRKTWWDPEDARYKWVFFDGEVGINHSASRHLTLEACKEPHLRFAIMAALADALAPGAPESESANGSEATSPAPEPDDSDSGASAGHDDTAADASDRIASALA